MSTPENDSYEPSADERVSDEVVVDEAIVDQAVVDDPASEESVEAGVWPKPSPPTKPNPPTMSILQKRSRSSCVSNRATGT